MHLTKLISTACFTACLTLSVFANSAADEVVYRVIPSGELSSVLANSAINKPIVIPSFAARVTPVTNAEFLKFVHDHPNWQRDLIPSIFADHTYLQQWKSATEPGDNINPQQPVTHVSWFAAQAFCETENARLPTWYEWEYLAAADETRPDARKDPKWLAKILTWYGQPSDPQSQLVGGSPNYYGVRDMHGLIWEWVDDFNALFISADSRNQGDPDKLKFCGAGAISLQDKENFAVLMRIALLSSLSGSDSTANLGFRCVRTIMPFPAN